MDNRSARVRKLEDGFINEAINEMFNFNEDGPPTSDKLLDLYTRYFFSWDEHTREHRDYEIPAHYDGLRQSVLMYAALCALFYENSELQSMGKLGRLSSRETDNAIKIIKRSGLIPKYWQLYDMHMSMGHIVLFYDSGAWTELLDIGNAEDTKIIRRILSVEDGGSFRSCTTRGCTARPQVIRLVAIELVSMSSQRIRHGTKKLVKLRFVVRPECIDCSFRDVPVSMY